MLDAYADGMNAGRGTLENPIEYRLMKVEPQPWAPMDAYGVLAMQSWNLETNAAQEVFAWLTRDEFDADALTSLLTYHPEIPPVDAYWDDRRRASSVS